MRRKVSFLLLLLVFSMGNIVGMTGAHPSKEQITWYSNQIQYNFTLQKETLNLNKTEDYNLKVYLFQDENPQLGAYFEFINFDYDIGESQLDLGNGTYIITFRSLVTQEAIPGTHNTILRAYHEGHEIDANLTLIIETDDTTAPILGLISPSTDAIRNSSAFKLQLELSDETEWRDISIMVAGEVYFYFKRTLDSFNNSEIAYNTTNLYLEKWVILDGFSGSGSNNLTIIGRDSSYNDATIVVELEGDYVKPIVSWKGIEDNILMTKTREVSISWEIIDASSIASQILYLENRQFLNPPLTNSQRQVNFTLAIPVDQSKVLDLQLVVTDLAGNKNSLDLRIIYDISSDQGDGYEINVPFVDDPIKIGGQSSQGRNILLLIGIPLMILIIGLSLYLINNRREGLEITSISKNREKLIKKPPFSEINQQNYPDVDGKVISDTRAIIDNIRASEHKDDLDRNIAYMTSDLFNLKYSLGEEQTSELELLNQVEAWLEKIKNEK